MKHPSVLWVEHSHDNFLWLVQLTHALNREFCWRFDRPKDHASISVLKTIETVVYESCGLTEFPQAMPDLYKVTGDPVSAYRAFYIGEKSGFATWRKRDVPQWYVKGLKESLKEGLKEVS